MNVIVWFVIRRRWNFNIQWFNLAMKTASHKDVCGIMSVQIILYNIENLVLISWLTFSLGFVKVDVFWKGKSL